MALSFLLLFGAGLFVRSLQNLQTTDTGVQMDNLVTFRLSPALSGYDDQQTVNFYSELLDRLRSSRRASSRRASPPCRFSPAMNGTAPCRSKATRKDGEDMQAFMNALSPGYFETMGIRCSKAATSGPRTSRRTRRSPSSTASSRSTSSAARAPSAGSSGAATVPETKLDVEIVGVVEDSLYEGPREGVRRQVFWPGWGRGSVTFYVRTTRRPPASST